jgi:hypothetical protein
MGVWWVWKDPYMLDVGWYRRDREHTKKGLANPDTVRMSGQGYPTRVLTLPYSGSQGQNSLLTRPVTLFAR